MRRRLPPRSPFTLLGLAAFFAACLSAAAVENDPPVFYCTQALAAPEIDGFLDDPAWRLAPVRYSQRVGKLAPMYPAAVRMLWDAEALYVGFDCTDPDLMSNYTERDSHIWEEGDCVEMFLLLPGEEERKVELELNPNQAFLDILHDKDGTAEQKFAWNWPGARWDVKLRGTLNDERLDRGWTAELMLPWQGVRSLGVAPPPDGLNGLKVLFLLVNRVRIGEGWLGREQSTWPSLSRMRIDLHDEYGQLKFVKGRTARMPLEGFTRIIKGHARRGDPLFPDYRGMAIPWEYDTHLEDAVLVWETQSVPQNPGDIVSFAFVGQTLQQGGSKNPDRASFHLLLNGRELLEFDPYRQDSHEWTADGVGLEFRHRTGRYWPSGLFVLKVPSSAVKPGEPQRLEARVSQKGARTRFIVKAWTDAALYEYLKTR